MTNIPPELYAEDKTLQARSRQFINRLFDEAEELLDRANPTMRVSILRAWLPSLMKELNKTNQGDELAELRNEMREMFKDIRGDGDEPDADT